jgi:glycosyltransferase involved in cell wall biosynthesis
VRVVVLTTSYPRFAGDAAGRFVADAVEHLRRRGADVEVVSPASFRHFGIAYGSGVVGNLRARPLKAFALPAFLGAFTRAARRASRDADLVHAHWLPAGAVARATGKPYVVQLWGTDVELARRTTSFARSILRNARLTICASTALADDARKLGAERVEVIPSGVEIPADVPSPADPPEILFAGRLSTEKGILELLEAAKGLPLVVAGDGPLRDRVPDALGMLPHEELVPLYGRAAIVACPSHREGFGVVCAEAMAHGRPVVASAVGGLLDLVADGETGLLVPPRDPAALRAALLRLMEDGELRGRLGAAGRERARTNLSWDAVTTATLEAYERAIRRSARSVADSPSAAMRDTDEGSGSG